MSSKFKSITSQLWGADGSRGFKLAAWAVAAAGLGAWTYYDMNKNKVEKLGAEDVDKMRSDRNAKILADQKAKDNK